MDTSPGCCISLVFLSYEAETAEATRPMLMAASSIPVTVRPNWTPRLLRGWPCSQGHGACIKPLIGRDALSLNPWDEDPVGMVRSWFNVVPKLLSTMTKGRRGGVTS